MRLLILLFALTASGCAHGLLYMSDGWCKQHPTAKEERCPRDR